MATLTPKQVQKQRQKIEKKIEEYELRLEQLQKDCPHTNATQKYGSSTGNWDRQDTYWIVHKCPDCDKRWTTPQ